MRRSPRKSAGNLEPENPVWVAYAEAMMPLSLPVAKATAALAPALPEARRILDVAAGSGLFGIEMLQGAAIGAGHSPSTGRPCSTWPRRMPAGGRGVADRLALRLPGSALELDLGTDYDLVMLPNFLHHFDEATNIALLPRRAQAARRGGRLAVIEFLRDEDMPCRRNRSRHSP